MSKLYHWEVDTMEEAKPHYIFTVTDSLAEVESRLDETWGETSIKSIQRIGESINFNGSKEAI